MDFKLERFRMTFSFKCPECGHTTAQVDADGQYCHYCSYHAFFVREQLNHIRNMISMGSVVACVNMEMYSDVLLIDQWNYRWCYFIDCIEAEIPSPKSQAITGNVLCRQDVEKAYSQMSPVDLLIMDPPPGYDGLRAAFYNMCGIVKIGGKIVFRAWDDQWLFVDELKEVRNIEIVSDLVIVDWK
jgi:DNA-directed RNA polymerase subunit RPC12/RpoP